jgi:2-(1,2-epoxy-1,2-dihydrophenyl)acetyl-CoA isomerase
MLDRLGPADGVLELRLNRPARLNALTLTLARELAAAVRDASADGNVRVLLLSGEGASFCAGKDRDDPATSEFVEALQDVARALMESGKPVVAAAQGWAVGAGLETLLNCDIVVASRDARFMLPEVNLGLFGTGGVLALLPRAVGLPRAKAMLMLGRELPAVDAHALGLIATLCEPQELMATARSVARELAQRDPRVLAEIKASLHRETFGELDDVLAREAQVHERLGVPRP